MPSLQSLQFKLRQGHPCAFKLAPGPSLADEWKFRLTAPRCGNHSPSVNSDQISESKEVKKWVDNYLGMGEWIMDQSVAVLGSSGWFKRER